MPKGTIRHWNEAKAYGFIQPDTGGADVFFHVSSLNDRAVVIGISRGQRVAFELATNKRTGKPTAINVRDEHNDDQRTMEPSPAAPPPVRGLS